jgi:plastocyanin
MSSPDSHEHESKGYSPHMRGVALGILVMGVSLAAVIILWTTIGYKGSAFSIQVMEGQQERLHEQYGLQPVPDISPEMLQVPPSLRNIATGANATNATTTTTTTTTGANATTTGANATTTGANATTTGANATTTGANATTTGATGNTTGTSATSADGGTSVSIVPGSSSLTTDAFSPNPIQVSVGNTVTWTNNDSQPHTVTSGSNGQPDNKFNSSPNFSPLLNQGQTFSFTFTEAGDYPYFCMLHPNMAGTVNVSS